MTDGEIIVVTCWSVRADDQTGEMVETGDKQLVESSNRQLFERGVSQLRGMGDSRREMVLNIVRKDGAGWEATVGQGTTRHEDPVVQRRRECVEGGGIQEVTTLVPKNEDDNLVFIMGGQVGRIGRTVYAQVDGGSAVSCISIGICSGFGSR